MKLWQKIFLLTLGLVIVLVNATSLVLLKNNHDLAIMREQQTALTRHSYLVNEIQNNIIYTQLVERTISLSDQQLNTVLHEVLNRQRDDSDSSAALYYKGQLDYASSQYSPAAELALLGYPDYSSRIVEDGDSVYLLVSSALTLNNDRQYQLISSYDISPTYELFNADFNQVRIIGIVSALLIAGILLLMVRMLLKPLRSLSRTTRQIASGDLKTRARVSGNDEVAEVARNLNSMADSIENNVTSLEQLAESRKVFIGNLAHEMKTPLTSILGFADLLRVQRNVSNDERQDYASVIVNETKRLQTLSGKLMELLSVGSMQLSLEDVDLNQMANDLGLVLQPVFAARHMDLISELPTQGAIVRADRELLRSLVYNLIDNGMKASLEGSSITIAAQILPGGASAAGGQSLAGKAPAPAAGGEAADAPAEITPLTRVAEATTEPVPREQSGSFASAPVLASQPQTAKQNLPRLLRLEVRDEGMGIPADRIAQLTEPFYMLDKARTRRYGGAGLGLALCAEIAKAHGSDLLIESEIGKGTTVSIVLPLVVRGKPDAQR